MCWFVRLKRRSRLSLVGIGHHRICAKLLAKVYRKHFPIEATADGGRRRLFVWSYRLSTFRNADSSMSRTKVYSFSTYTLGKRLFWSYFGEILHPITNIYLEAVHKLCRLKGGGSQKLPILPIKTTTNRGRDQKLPILRRHSLWTAPCIFWLFISKIEKLEKISCQIVVA